MNLNLGSGVDYREGNWINLDYADIKCDVKHDLKVFPYPFEADSFTLIECNAVLEHLPIPIMKSLIDECFRILKKNGVLIVRVPHFSSHHSWNNIEHVKGFSIFTLDSYADELNHSQSDYMHDFKWSKVMPRIVFGKKYALWNYLIEPLANALPQVYESTGLCYLFPAEGVCFRMVK